MGFAKTKKAGPTLSSTGTVTSRLARRVGAGRVPLLRRELGRVPRLPWAWMASPDSPGDAPEFLDALADCSDSGAGLASAARRSGSPSSRSMTAVRINVRVDGFHNTRAIFMRDSDGTKKKVNVAIGMADRIENSTRKINNENHIKKA